MRIIQKNDQVVLTISVVCDDNGSKVMVPAGKTWKVVDVNYWKGCGQKTTFTLERPGTDCEVVIDATHADTDGNYPLEFVSTTSVVTDPSPVRVIIDMTGGLFNAAIADRPATVMVLDVDDDDGHETARASVVPGFERYNGATGIWSDVNEAAVDPAKVAAAFDGRSLSVEIQHFLHDPDGDPDRAGDGYYFKIVGQASWSGPWATETEAEQESKR